MDAFGRSADKPRLEYCEGQNGTIIYIRAVQGHSHSITINPTLFSVKEVPLSWEEHILHVVSSSNFESILGSGLLGRRMKFEKHETSLFLLTPDSARFVMEIADDGLDRTRS